MRSFLTCFLKIFGYRKYDKNELQALLRANKRKKFMTGNNNYMSEPAPGNDVYPEDVQVLNINGREIFLVGSSRIAKKK